MFLYLNKDLRYSLRINIYPRRMFVDVCFWSIWIIRKDTEAYTNFREPYHILTPKPIDLADTALC